MTSRTQRTEFNVFTFNNASNTATAGRAKSSMPTLSGRHRFVDNIGTADGDCTVNTQRHVIGSPTTKGGESQLYTDRASSLSPTIENAKQLLNQRQIKGSFAMLGGCAGVLPTKMSDVSGGEISYLGNAANGSQSTGIVPYLLTALGSGGQFIYVREDQLTSAADFCGRRLTVPAQASGATTSATASPIAGIGWAAVSVVPC